MPTSPEDRGAARPGALRLVGNTPLVDITLPSVAGDTTLTLKVEAANPTGSMKDRMALAMIEAAERDGRLQAGQRVVEYTGGSTGVSLAFVCAAKGYPLDIVTSDAFAREKLDHMRVLGAHLHIVVSDGGRMTADLTRSMIDRAHDIADRTGAFWTDQMNNADQMDAYRELADELHDQLPEPPAGFVQAIGTAASFVGAGRRLREHYPGIALVAVEPAESAVLSGGVTGAHGIDGIGAGYVVPMWDPALPDGIELVSTADAMDAVVELARRTGLFAGASTGANLVAAGRLARRLPAGARIVTVLADTGIKYLSKPALQQLIGS